MTTAVTILLIGASGSIALPALQTRLMDVAGDAQGLAAAGNRAAAQHLANAVGAYLGGLVLAAGYGYTSPAAVGALLAAGGLAVLTVSLADAANAVVLRCFRPLPPPYVPGNGSPHGTSRAGQGVGDVAGPGQAHGLHPPVRRGPGWDAAVATLRTALAGAQRLHAAALAASITGALPSWASGWAGAGPARRRAACPGARSR